MALRRFAWAVMAAALSPLLFTACVAAKKYGDCLGFSDPTSEEARAAVDAILAEVRRSGVRVDAETLRDPVLFARYLDAFHAAAGVPEHLRPTRGEGDFGVAQQRFDVTLASYCGPGHDNFATSVPVVPCLNQICEAHDACYSECSGELGLCIWSQATDPCDQAMFESVKSCDFGSHGFDTCVTSLAVLHLALVAYYANHNNPVCNASEIVCPGKGPCLVDRSSDACRACLAASDPDAGCLAEDCADTGDVEQCYKASCPEVARCYGGWGDAGAP